MEASSVDIKVLKKKLVVRFVMLPLLVCLFILIPAGTFDFWQVYVYFGLLMVLMIFVMRYFLKYDPAFLEHRMKMKEHERKQKNIISISSIIYLIGFLLPGFDRRFGWSDIPAIIVTTADILVVAGYIFIIVVFKENRYASRVIEIQKEQTVISTGPYSIVRHPMYLGLMVMMLATPFALGSYWALIPFALVPITLVYRILNEETVLSEQLIGYKEYCTTVRYRLIPYIW